VTETHQPHHEGRRSPAPTPGNALEEHRTDQIVSILSLEYQTLRAEILARSAYRFQTLTIMGTAGALVAAAITAGVEDVRWPIVAVIAGIYILVGLIAYFRMGTLLDACARRVAEIEKMVNVTMNEGYGSPALLVWESRTTERSRLQRILSGRF
jgi:hypothetical protein